MERSLGILLKSIQCLFSNESCSYLDDISSELLDRWKEHRENIKFVFIGDGSLWSFLQLYTNLLPSSVASHISFLGSLSSSDLQQYLSYHHASIIALINPRIDGETFGYTHIEAASMGIPVLAFHRGAAVESVSSGILLEIPENRGYDLEKVIYHRFLQGILTLFDDFLLPLQTSSDDNNASVDSDSDSDSDSGSGSTLLSETRMFSRENVCEQWNERSSLFSLNESVASLLQVITALVN
jgi:glycosyltransferase involved in cell wall biosynthesis